MLSAPEECVRPTNHYRLIYDSRICGNCIRKYNYIVGAHNERFKFSDLSAGYSPVVYFHFPLSARCLSFSFLCSSPTPTITLCRVRLRPCWSRLLSHFMHKFAYALVEDCARRSTKCAAHDLNIHEQKQK